MIERWQAWAETGRQTQPDRGTARADRWKYKGTFTQELETSWFRFLPHIMCYTDFTFLANVTQRAAWHLFFWSENSAGWRKLGSFACDRRETWQHNNLMVYNSPEAADIILFSMPARQSKWDMNVFENIERVTYTVKSKEPWVKKK